jgi:hypothetical protein
MRKNRRKQKATGFRLQTSGQRREDLRLQASDFRLKKKATDFRLQASG